MYLPRALEVGIKGLFDHKSKTSIQLTQMF